MKQLLYILFLLPFAASAQTKHHYGLYQFDSLYASLQSTTDTTNYKPVGIYNNKFKKLSYWLWGGGSSLTINNNTSGRLLMANGGTSSIDAIARISYATSGAGGVDDYLTIGSGVGSVRQLYNAVGGGSMDFTLQRLGVDMISFGSTLTAPFGVGTSGQSSGRAFYFYDRVAAAYRGGISSDGTWNIQNLGGTGTKVVLANASGDISASSVTSTELGYVAGVTSAIQTQLNGKQGALTLTTTGTSGAATLTGNTLNIPNYATTPLSDGDKGDITVSSSGATWTIDNLAVTNAKINDVAIGKVTGRTTYTSGRILIGDGSADATTSANLTYSSNTLTNNGITKLNGAVYNYAASLAGGINLTLDDTYCYLNVDASGSSGSANLYLPSANGKAGLVYYIKKVDNSAIPVTIYPNGAQTIEGAASKTLATQYKAIKIYADGTSTWLIEYQN